MFCEVFVLSKSSPILSNVIGFKNDIRRVLGSIFEVQFGQPALANCSVFGVHFGDSVCETLCFVRLCPLQPSPTLLLCYAKPAMRPGTNP